MFDGIERDEIGLSGRARVGEPAAQPARLVQRSDPARARQRERHQTIGRTMRDERRLERRLFAQIKCEQKTDFHKEQFISNQ